MTQQKGLPEQEVDSEDKGEGCDTKSISQHLTVEGLIKEEERMEVEGGIGGYEPGRLLSWSLNGKGNDGFGSRLQR